MFLSHSQFFTSEFPPALSINPDLYVISLLYNICIILQAVAMSQFITQAQYYNLRVKQCIYFDLHDIIENESFVVFVLE